MLMRRHHHPESPDYYSSLAAASAGVTSPSLSLGIISSSLEVCSFFNLIIWSCLFIFSLFFLSFLPPFVFGDYEKTKNISVSTRCVFVSFCQNGILYLSIRRVFWRCRTHTHNTHWLSLFDNILLPNHPSSQRCFFLIGRQPHSPGCDLTNSRCRAKIISRWSTCWKKPK